LSAFDVLRQDRPQAASFAPRARATRDIWSVALAGEMCGSSPEAERVTMWYALWTQSD
jgi:hypothetical protein